VGHETGGLTPVKRLTSFFSAGETGAGRIAQRIGFIGLLSGRSVITVAAMVPTEKKRTQALDT